MEVAAVYPHSSLPNCFEEFKYLTFGNAASRLIQDSQSVKDASDPELYLMNIFWIIAFNLILFECVILFSFCRGRFC